MSRNIETRLLQCAKLLEIAKNIRRSIHEDEKLGILRILQINRVSKDEGRFVHESNVKK